MNGNGIVRTAVTAVYWGSTCDLAVGDKGTGIANRTLICYRHS